MIAHDIYGGARSFSRSRLIVRTVIQMNSEMTPSSNNISIARIGRKRQASTNPQPTPIGVITSSNGFAIFTG